MPININKKITEKIKEKNFPDDIRNFIGDILVFELCHIEEKTPRFTEKYEPLIRKYAGAFKIRNK